MPVLFSQLIMSMLTWSDGTVHIWSYFPNLKVAKSLVHTERVKLIITHDRWNFF